MRVIDLAGQRFKSLVVLARSPRAGRTYWLCLCDCGRKTEAIGYDLRTGRTCSCGCMRGETGKAKWTTHGLYANRAEYDSWSHMRRRCSDTQSPDFKNYGGRGIAVCERWNDFGAFYADMGPRPSRLHTLERKNNDLGYSPENCIWATRAVQNQNKRNTVRVAIDGRNLTISEIAALAGLSYMCVYKRVRRGVIGKALLGVTA